MYKLNRVPAILTKLPTKKNGVGVDTPKVLRLAKDMVSGGAVDCMPSDFRADLLHPRSHPSGGNTDSPWSSRV